MNNQSPLRFCFSSSAYSLQRISIMSRIALFYFKGNVPFHLLMIFGKHTFVSKKSKQCADFHLFWYLLCVLFIKKRKTDLHQSSFSFCSVSIHTTKCSSVTVFLFAVCSLIDDCTFILQKASIFRMANHPHILPLLPRC